jgi:hypothetical protein
MLHHKYYKQLTVYYNIKYPQEAIRTKIRSIGLWWWSINITVTVLDSIHCLAFYSKHSILETGFCHQNSVFLSKGQDDGNVQNCDSNKNKNVSVLIWKLIMCMYKMSICSGKITLLQLSWNKENMIYSIVMLGDWRNFLNHTSIFEAVIEL